MKKTAEIVIIGGGCMGASVAYHLAKRGITNIVLVEREPLLAMGSTGRNAGGVRHQFSTENNVKLSIESIRLFEHFAEEVGYEIDFHQDGYLFLLSEQENWKNFQSNVDMQRRLGIEVDLLTAEEARRLAPGLETDGVIGATFCARDGIADPNGVTIGFAKAAQAVGIEIYRETEVLDIINEAGRVAGVKTANGNISTRKVVNAAGPYARNIGQMINVDIPVLPFRRHIFITEPIAASPQRAGSSKKQNDVPASRIMVIDFETTFYFHREGAAILFGMSDPDEPSSYDTTVSWEFLESVTSVAVKRLPRLADSAVAHAWAGLYEMTPDRMPIIGPAPGVEGFYIIAGFSGHGFQHCPAAGRLLADIITQEKQLDPDPANFSLTRFSEGATLSESNVV